MVGCLHNLTNTTGCPLQSRCNAGDESKYPGDADAVPLRHPTLGPHHLGQAQRNLKQEMGNRKWETGNGEIILPGPSKPCHCLGPSHQQLHVLRLCSVHRTRHLPGRTPTALSVGAISSLLGRPTAPDADSFGPVPRGNQPTSHPYRTQVSGNRVMTALICQRDSGVVNS